MNFRIVEEVLERYEGNDVNVSIPMGVKSIADNAFSECNGLTSITIPDGVTSIGNEAFKGCSSLISFIIPNGVTRIGSFAFYNCSSLTSVTIPDSLTSIGDLAFSGCSKLTSITIPDSVTRIGGRAFWNCKNLTNLIFQANNASNAQYAFEFCNSLKNLIIPDSVKSVERKFLESFLNLEHGYISDVLALSSLSPISKFICALVYCDSPQAHSVERRLEYDLYIKREKKRLLDAAMASGNGNVVNYIMSLTEIPLQDINVCLDKASTAGHTEITTMLLDYKRKAFTPGEIERYEKREFEKEIGLKPLSVLELRKFWKHNENHDGTISLQQYVGSETQVLIPAKIGKKPVKYIGEVFRNYKNLIRVSVQDGIEHIGYRAFANCKNLEEVYLSDNVKVIGAEAFLNCSNLKCINVPVQAIIGPFAFSGCKLVSGIVPSTKQVDSNAWALEIKYKRALAKEMIRSSWFTPGDLDADWNTIEHTDGFYINRYNGRSTAIVVPSSISGKSIIGIDVDTFSASGKNGRKSPYQKKMFSLREVFVTEGIRHIERGVFDGCVNIRNIYLPESISECRFDSTNLKKTIFHVIAGTFAERFLEEAGANFKIEV